MGTPNIDHIILCHDISSRYNGVILLNAFCIQSITIKKKREKPCRNIVQPQRTVFSNMGMAQTLFMESIGSCKKFRKSSFRAGGDVKGGSTNRDSPSSKLSRSHVRDNLIHTARMHDDVWHCNTIHGWELPLVMSPFSSIFLKGKW